MKIVFFITEMIPRKERLIFKVFKNVEHYLNSLTQSVPGIVTYLLWHVMLVLGGQNRPQRVTVFGRHSMILYVQGAILLCNAILSKFIFS